jgi:AraC family transcriptional regulator
MAAVSRTPPDRLRDLVDTLLGGLDDGLDGGSMARRAYLSRFHFDRLVAGGLGEGPAAFRRRLLLERAAWQLMRAVRATDAAIDAGYGSSEAFTRAFRRAYGVPPSRFAAAGRDFRIAAPNGVHFHPPAGLLVPGDHRSDAMDVTDRLLEHDHWHTGRLLDRAGDLSLEDLHREIRPGHQVLSFDGPEPSVWAMLDRLVWTKEVWAAAMNGADMPSRDGGRDLDQLRRRFSEAGGAFLATARRVRERAAWDDAFVDALCDPPQSFTFGAVVAHVLTFSAHRRQVLGQALATLGVDAVDTNCPIEWERLRAADRPLPAARLRGTGS